MDPQLTRSLLIALFVSVIFYVALRFASREQRSFSGDLVVTFGAYKWIGLVSALLICGFMSTMLIMNGFVGPKGQEMSFWSIYTFSLVSAVIFMLSALFTIMFPVTVRGDTIYYMTFKFRKHIKDISQIECVYRDRLGFVNFEFGDGNKLKLSEYDSGAEAVLAHIFSRLTEQVAEEFEPDEDQTIH